MPTGRRAGYAVVVAANRGAPGRPASPAVVTEDRQLRRLTTVDVPTPVQPLLTVRIPTGFNAKSPKSRRDLAATLRIAVAHEPPPRHTSRGGDDDARRESDAEVTRPVSYTHLDVYKRQLQGTPRYLAAVALELPRFTGIPYVVQVDDQRIETEAMLVAVANGGTFGGGMKVCPDASMTDGLFDVMILHKIGRGEFLRIFPKVFSGGHVSHPAVEILRGRRVHLEADGIDSQADGEDFLPLPVDLEVVPGALAVVAP